MTQSRLAGHMRRLLPQLLTGGRNINELLESVGSEMDGGDALITRLLCSRWVELSDAGHWTTLSEDQRSYTDLGRLASLFDLDPRQEESSAEFRRRLVEHVLLHRAGVTTPRALLRRVATLYEAVSQPRVTYDDDALGRLARISESPLKAGEYLEITGSATMRFFVESPQGRLPLCVRLVAAPPMPASVKYLGVGGSNDLVVNFRGLFPEYADITIKATEQDIRVPCLTNLNTGLLLLYTGRIPKGGSLLLRSGQPPVVQSQEAVPIGQVVVILSTSFGKAGDSEGSVYSMGPLASGAPKTTRLARYGEFRRDSRLFEFSYGESRFRYRTIYRAQLRTYLAGFVKEPELGTLISEAAEQESAPPRMDIEFSWRQAEAGSYRLQIPDDYLPPSYAKQADGRALFRRDLERLLAYGRAAGIRVFEPESLPR